MFISISSMIGTQPTILREIIKNNYFFFLHKTTNSIVYLPERKKEYRKYITAKMSLL